MKRLHQRGRAGVAALLLAMLAAAAVPAAPAVVVPDDGGSIAAWLEGWLARLVPDWVVAGSETPEPSAPPSGDGTAFDDTSSSETCDPTISVSCQEGETLPDLDPDG